MARVWRSLAVRIAVAILAVSGLAISVVAAGMMTFGHDATLAAVAAAAIAALALAALLGRLLNLPLAAIAVAAGRIAEGNYRSRVPRTGPTELLSLADSFNRMAEALEEQEATRNELIMNFAHELRTPLTNLLGYLQAIRDGVMDGNVEVFDSLREEVDRLVRLSHALGYLAEGQGMAPDPDLVEVEVGAQVSGAVELVRPAMERRGLQLELQLEAGLGARASPDHLAQILGNLLQNALRYTPPQGRVAISARHQDKQVVVSVESSGEPIPPAELRHIFDRFYRLEKSRDQSRGGAGIGLAIVKRLVESAGGAVGAESGPRGNRFWFTLPSLVAVKPGSEG